MIIRLAQKNIKSSNTQLRIAFNRYQFGIGNTILIFIRTILNKIRWEDNREFTSLQKINSKVPRSTEEATALFISLQQQKSLAEKARMQRIDEILGTNTYYHETKIYQERLNSNHIMQIGQLKRQNRQKSREILNYTNPQSSKTIKYKNKRQYYKFIEKLRVYPLHQTAKIDLTDEDNIETINFLTKQALYTKISLKQIQMTIESIQNEITELVNQRPLESIRYTYFRPLLSSELIRIDKKQFSEDLLTQDIKTLGVNQGIQPVISLNEIYESLKIFDTDERVAQYLKKVENQKIQYIFSSFSYDSNQNMVAIMVDLLGSKQQYCLIIKNLANQKLSQEIIFNVKPNTLFSHDGKKIYYIQRSPEGGWIQLISRNVDSVMDGRGKQDKDQLLYRCSPQHSLKINTDTNRQCIFLHLSTYNIPFSEQLFILHQIEKEGKQELKLIQIDSHPKCKYSFDISPLGLVFVRYFQNNQFLKYGKCEAYAKQIHLIPYKNYVQNFEEEKIGMSQLLLSGQQGIAKVSPLDFDIENKRVIFQAQDVKFIKDFEVRSTHIVIVMNYLSTYDKSILYLLPFKKNSFPHSLILGGGNELKLRKNSYSYNKQIVQFLKPNGLISTSKLYNIWKRQLSDFGNDLSKYHIETIIVRDGSNPLSINIICRNIFVQEDLPILLYFSSTRQQINENSLKQFLQKGVMVVQFIGRGTLSKDLQNFLGGSKDKIINQITDLQDVIRFIGHNFNQNISLYCKDQLSSLIGLWTNIRFPFLFTSSVLHNGVYDLSNISTMKHSQNFFGKMENQAESNNIIEKWNNFNILKYNYKRPFQQKVKKQSQNQQKVTDQLENDSPKKSLQIYQVGSFQNILISSDNSYSHKLHARTLINFIRRNPYFKYEQVYLKQYNDGQQIDLYNLSYIYMRLHERMKEQQNDIELVQERANIQRQLKNQN